MDSLSINESNKAVVTEFLQLLKSHLISKDAIEKKTETPMKSAFEWVFSMQKDVHFQ